jgi:hypothetical protein
MTEVNKAPQKTSFESSFEKNCLKGRCEGWITKGEWFVETDKNGDNILDLNIGLRAP